MKRLILTALLCLLPVSALAGNFETSTCCVVANYNSTGFLYLSDGTDLSPYIGTVTVRDASGNRARGTVLSVASGTTTESANLLSNPGFETGGTGGDFDGGAEVDDGTSDDFTDWGESGTAPDLYEATTTKDTGSYGLKLTDGGGNAFAGETLGTGIDEKKPYAFRFAHRGDGSVTTKYRVINVTAAADLLGGVIDTGYKTAAWTNFVKNVISPAGCNALRPYFYQNDLGAAYYDTAEFVEITSAPSTGMNVKWKSIDSGFDYNDASGYTVKIWQADSGGIRSRQRTNPGTR